MNLPNRLPFEALIAAALALGSCSEGAKLVTHDEAVDIADDAVDGSARLRDLEGRVEALEAKLGE